MLQQCKLRMMGGKQECRRRMHLGAKIEWVKWKDLRIKSGVKVANWKVVVSHPWGDDILCIIFLNVSEVPNGTTAGSKKVGISTNNVMILHSSSSK